MFVSPDKERTAEAVNADSALTRRPHLLLLAALPFLPFANGTQGFPAAARLAPALLLPFVRATRTARGLACICLLTLTALTLLRPARSNLL